MSWRERIEAAEKRGHFTVEDENDAQGWDYDPVGELSALLPGAPEGEPEDKELRELGLAFCGHVMGNLFTLAWDTLTDIERRAWELRQ